MNKKNIAVVYGGMSAEHEVSINSGINVISSLDKNKYEIYPLYITREGKWFLQNIAGKASSGDVPVSPVIADGYNLVSACGKTKLKIDLFFPVIHGTMGEDGTIQGLFEMMNAAYAGSSVSASAVGMNKIISKNIANLLGIPCAPHIYFNDAENTDFASAEQECAKMGFPVFVKPVKLGSSIGVTKVSEVKELKPAVLKAFQFDAEVMAEKAVQNMREIVCGVIGEGAEARAFDCGEIKVLTREFYDYEAKYILEDDEVKIIVPADLDKKISGEMRECAVRIYRAIGAAGLSRVDFLLDGKTNKFYFCEINTMPGLTSHSIYPRLAKNAGVSMAEFLDTAITLGLERQKTKTALALYR